MTYADKLILCAISGFVAPIVFAAIGYYIIEPIYRMVTR